MFSAPWRAWAEGWGLSQSPPATELISPSARSLVKHLQKGAQRTSGLETCVCVGEYPGGLQVHHPPHACLVPLSHLFPSCPLEGTRDRNVFPRVL